MRMIGLAALCVTCLATTVSAATPDLLSIGSGALVLSWSDEYAKDWHAEWSAIALIDDTTSLGWASSKRAPFPHWFVIELPGRCRLSSIALTNLGVQEKKYPGISARAVTVMASTTSPDSGFERIAEGEVPKGGEASLAVDPPVEARWLRIEITSNWGNADWTELMEVSATGELLEPADASDATGVFDTNYGATALSVSGRTTTGCYDEGRSKVFGDADGRSLRLEWRNHENRGAGLQGSALLVVGANGKALNGLWYGRDAHSSLVGRWWGDRTGDDPSTVCGELDLLEALEESGRVTLYGIHFEIDSDRLTADATPALQEILTALHREESLQLRIVGHTDSTASDAHNLDLSKRRAASVMAWLVEHGVDPARLSSAGMGEKEPVADNATPQGRLLNRRVEILTVP